MSMQQSGYIWENGKTHGNLIVGQQVPIMIQKFHLRELVYCFIRRKPTDVYNLVIFVRVADWHRHVIIGRHNLEKISLMSHSMISLTNLLEIVTKPPFQKLCVLLKQFEQKIVESGHRIPPALEYY